jgi:hypothetical protein
MVLKETMMVSAFFVSELVQCSVDRQRSLVVVLHATKRYHVHYVLFDWSLGRPRTKVLSTTKAEALVALETPFDEVSPVFSSETKQERKDREEASFDINLHMQAEA